MLIWLNGAFGAGKTQTAFELQRRLANAHVADPELPGFALHRMLPKSARADFQDLPEWRTTVVAALRRADFVHDGPVLVPMTIVRDDYFDEIIGGLRAAGVDVRHYALTATAETLRNRLHQRIKYVSSRLVGGGETWALAQIDRCVAALSMPRYATQIATDDRSTDEIVEVIARDAALPLVRPRLSPMRYQLRRIGVGVRHIRFG